MAKSVCVALLILLFAVLGYAYAQSSSQSQGRTTSSRVLYYGDSLAAESAPYARANLGRRVLLIDRSYPGSAPCDWIGRARRDRVHRTRAVIIETFGNNISSCEKVGGKRVRSGSAAYWKMYQNQINRLVSVFSSKTLVYLTAAPAAKNDRSGGSSHKARMLKVMLAVAGRHRNVRVIDAGRAVENPAGRYAAYGKCIRGAYCSNYPRRGWTRWRAHDGLHFCPRIYWATISMLRHCPVVSSGAKRFGIAQTEHLKHILGS